VKTGKDFVCGILQPCIRLVQPSRCFACQLTELVAIGHMRKCPKNQIRTHYVILLQNLAARPELPGAAGAAGGAIAVQATPDTYSQGFRRTTCTLSSKSSRTFVRIETGLVQYQGYRMPPGESHARHPRSGGIQNAPEATIDEPRPKYDAEIGQATAQNCTVQIALFWMALMNVYPAAPQVNSFFSAMQAFCLGLYRLHGVLNKLFIII